MEQLLYDLVIVFGLGMIVVLIFSKIRMPPLLGFLLTGVLAGPYGLKLILGRSHIEDLAEIGVVLLLFTIGMEFSLPQLLRLWRVLLGGGLLQVLVTGSAAAGVASAFGCAPGQAVLIGCIVALSSTAIVMRILSERNETTTPSGQISLGILIFQDLAIVPMLFIVPFLAEGGADWRTIGLTLAKAVGLVTAILVFARVAVPWLLRQVIRSRSQELFLLTIIVICLGTAWLTHWFGLSLALGAFLAGLVISQSEYSHHALSVILPLRDAFASLFFVSIGMLLNVGFLVEEPLLVLSATAAAFLGKGLIVFALVKLLGYSIRIAILAGLLLAQVGEFSFLLIHAGFEANLITAEMRPLLIAMTVLTMAMTPLIDLAAPAISQWIAGKAPARKPGDLDPGLNDHVIIIGYGINGQNVARTLKHISLPYMILELNPETVQRCHKQGEPIWYGDATQPETLRHAGINNARVVVVTIPDAAAARRIVQIARDLNPGVHLIVRTRFVQEVAELHRMGANEVVPEEFETSIEIFSRVLQTYMVPRNVMDKLTRDIRTEGYDMLRVQRDAYRPVEGLQRFLGNVQFEAYGVVENCPAEGKTLAESRIRQETGALVLGIHRDHVTTPNPPADWRLEVYDVVLLIGSPEALGKAGELFLEK